MTEQAWRPRPCVRTQESGSSWVPVRPHYEGLPSQEGQTVRMKGGESRPDHGDESPRFGPDETVPGWKTPQWSARRRRARKARGTFTEVPDQDVAPIGAPLPHMCEGQGKRGRTLSPPNSRGDESRLCPDARRCAC